MQIVNEVKLDFDDVLIRPKRSDAASRSAVKLKKSYNFKNSGLCWEGLPIFAANMDAVGTFAMAKVFVEQQMCVALHKFYKLEDIRDFLNQLEFNGIFTKQQYIAYTCGILDNDIAKLKAAKAMFGEHLYMICVDVANGYTNFFQDKVKEIRDIMPTATIMAGNVVTPEMVSELILSGAADIVKIGIGPGSVCTTRLKTGVGFPQLSAIIECADAAHGLGGHVCADGGCRSPGDIAKAFGAGADFVMLGGMLAGHDECDGEWETKPEVIYPDNTSGLERVWGGVVTGRTIKTGFKFYGMSSRQAADKYHGGLASYRAEEGGCTIVPYQGPVENTIQDILGGLRSTCTYVGAKSLKDLPKCTTFIRVSR